MFCRARCEKNKEVRNKEIVEACISLYSTSKFEDITISKITKEAGWTRSNFYKYYTTKEEAFLDVVLFLFDEWNDTVVKYLSIKKELTPYSFANLWIESHEKNHMYTKLTCLTSTLMEDHSSLDKIIAFKKELLIKILKISQIIQEKTGATEKDFYNFFISQSAIINGGYSYFKLSDIKKKAIKSLDIDYDVFEVKEIIIENIEMSAERYLFKINH